ncbi:MAG: aminotransferase class I/II-fold pyridoxal phosphate-dependent enzyme [Candidatus Thermoplasmatota archaeon]|jgi:aspartate/methionine/tyrosine aminotransferase|nr:aminotransferase class I/II-fold pyridoxal phosphate-dependent enzyme [Candidatus Thermoplasmatota archaeon]
MTSSRHTIPVTKRADEIKYAIRDIEVHATKLERKGIDILKLNIGDPVKYDFDTPDFVKEACINAIRDGNNFYGPSSGIPELLENIVGKERREGNRILQENVLVTTGVTESLQILIGATFQKGERFLIPGPSYPPYITYTRFFNGDPVPYHTIEEEDWQPDIDDIRKKITDDTRALAVINPNNPTGALYGEKTLKEIIDVVGEHKGMYLVSDQIYDKMSFEASAINMGSLTKDVPMVVLNGISKVFLAPGWRCGYMALNDTEGAMADIWDGVQKQARARLCSNVPSQYGLMKAFEDTYDDYLTDLNAKLKKRRDFTYKRINEIEGLSASLPGGAFYIFPKIEDPRYQDDEDFVLKILKNCHVLTVHGSGFCPVYGKGHFRIVFLPKEKILGEALDRIDRFLKL